MGVIRILVAAATAVMVLATSAGPAAAQQAPGAEPAPEASGQGSVAVAAAPVLGAAFVLEGVWLAPGVASLGWGDTERATGYELMYRGPDGWVLLSEREPSGDVSVAFEGSSAMVGGLPVDGVEWWFAVRARNAFGVSEWSQAAAVRVPQRSEVEPLFDPFTATTRSGIDLERLREAVATVTPGEADCAAAPALDVEGVTVVDPPADLDDPDTELTVAEVVRVAGGCLVVEHVALAGRTVAQVRDLLAADASVHAVGEPVRGNSLDDNTGAHTHTGAHHDDGAGAQWHLPQPTMTALWNGWSSDSDAQVIVAVLDSGVDITHPDFTENENVPPVANTNNRIVGHRGCHVIDDEGHGTQMAGVIAAERGGGYVAGVAPEAKILPLRVVDRGDCTESPVPVTPPEGIAEAVNRGARVINMSIAGSTRHDRPGVVAGGVGIPSYDTYELVLRAAAMLGVVPVTSAGNCGDADGNGLTAEQDDDCPEQDARERPALYDDVITVAAVNRSGSRADFSSAHVHVDVAAPGVGILTASRCSIHSSCTHVSEGTSPAAAFVSGVVAHLLNRYPQAAVGQVRRALESSARDRGRVGRDDEFGHGIVDPAAAVIALGGLVQALEPVGPAGAFRSLSAGARHTCGSRDNGAVVCWGLDAVVDDTPDAAFASLSSPPGADFVCGVRQVDQAVVCWGDVPEEITTDVAGARVLDETGATAPDGRFENVVVGDRHVCGVRPGGRVVCWGDNASGQTDAPVAGFGQSSSAYVTAIAAGGEHTCALAQLTGLVCWGEDQGGRLPPSSSTVVAQQVAAGAVNTCVIGSDDTLHCFGSNSQGVIDVPAGSFAALDAGSHHVCAISASRGRGLRCWGDSSDGRLAAPAGRYLQVAAGGRHSCALSVYARVVCWGDNTNGQAPRQARLNSLSLTAGGADLLVGRFRADVFDYSVITSETSATLRAAVNAVDETRSRICAGSGSGVRCSALSRSAPVSLADGDTITVSVRALFGFGESRTYRINVVEPPRLAALRVISGVPGSHCRPTCPELTLSPSFDRDVFNYTVVAPADVSRVTVSFTQVGGRAAVSPADADDAVSGHQVALSTDGGFVAVDAGGQHACGIKTGRSVECWGFGRSGRADPPSGAFGTVSAGWEHSCGLLADGTVDCWGDNAFGQSNAPAGVFRSVSAGGAHSCGLGTDAAVVCWGDNAFGQSAAPRGFFSAVAAGALSSCGLTRDIAGPLISCWGSGSRGRSGSWRSVAVAQNQVCGLATDGSVQCWRSGGSLAVPSGSFRSVTAGSLHVCGLRVDNSVVCWGDNRAGQAYSPAGSFSAVSAESDRSCGLRTNGTVLCWGDGDSGQSEAPSGSFSSVAAGGAHSCGIKPDRTVQCWGNSHSGQSGAPSGSFAAVTAGRYHSCGIKTDASVVCWGANDAGQSGAPSGSFAAVTAGSYHSCAIKSDAGVVCWGEARAEAPSGSFRAVDVGLFESCGIKADRTIECWPGNVTLGPSAASGTFSAVTVGKSNVCGLSTSGTIECWGNNNFGQTVGEPSGVFSAVSAGAYHICGLRPDGRVECWGNGRDGQTDAPAGPFSAVTAGTDHTCGLRVGGAVECWGARQLWLEPAEPAHITVAVTSPFASGSSAGYILRVERPKPTLERQPPAVTSSRSASVRGQAPEGLRQRLDDLWRHCAELSTGCDKFVNNCVDGSSFCADVRSMYLALLQEHNTGDEADSTGAEPIPAKDPASSSGEHSQQDEAAHQQPTQSPEPRAGSPSADPGRSHRTAPCPSPSVDSAGRVVAITDSVLRAQINRRLGNAPDAAVTAAEMAELTTLRLPADTDAARVVSLSGLEHATNLAWLGLHGHEITDVSALSCLTSLTVLELGVNDISDISALSTLTGLTSLGLAGNSIADISALSALRSLTALDLSDNSITAVTSLSGLNSLQSLNLGRNQITSLSSLSALTALEALYAYGNKITDVAALSGLTSLTSLYLDHNNITAIASLAGLTSLRVLGLGDNQISDITALSGLASLKALYLFDNDIADASTLSGLNSLSTLWIDGNDLTSPYGWASPGRLGYLDARHNLIADIAPLDTAGAPGATVHSEPQRVTTARVSDASLRSALLAALGKTTGGTLSPAEIATIERLERVGPRNDTAPISDLSGLEHATSLTDLRLRNNNIADIEPIAGLDNLQRLDLQANRFTDLAQLDTLTSLRWLNLMQNNIASIDALPALSGLEMLFVDFNQITDITPLAGRSSLTRLGLVGNNITDISTLAQLTNLDWVMISANNITDIGALAGLDKIHYLRATNNNIADLTPLAGLTALTNLHLYRNNITDLEPLRGLTRLRFLDLRDNDITSIESLTGLTSLGDLYIGDNHITDFTPIDGIAGLTVHGRDDQTPTN